MNLREYALALDKALRWNKPFAAYNKDIGHARVIVSLAFAHAKKTILLLSNRLDPELYADDDFLDEAKSFLTKRRAKLRILVESEIDPQHRLVELLREHRDKVTLKRVPSDVQERYDFNFMVVDDKGYRFETDRAEHQAIVMFNSEDGQHAEELIARLKGGFRNLEGQAQELDW